jgi:hypothetical protein
MDIKICTEVGLKEKRFDRKHYHKDVEVHFHTAQPNQIKQSISCENISK